MNHIYLTEEEIEIEKWINAVKDPKAGGISTFLGTTRDTFKPNSNFISIIARY